jgi:hypothetical protein
VAGGARPAATPSRPGPGHPGRQCGRVVEERCPWSRTAAMTVHQPTPRERPTSATAWLFRPTWRQARARSVSDARAAMSGLVSLHVSRRSRRRHSATSASPTTTTTGRPPPDRSRTFVRRQPFDHAFVPQPEQPTTVPSVSTSLCGSPSIWTAANSTKPSIGPGPSRSRSPVHRGDPVIGEVEWQHCSITTPTQGSRGPLASHVGPAQPFESI